MRQRLFIFGTIALVLLLLVGLNAASYMRPEQEPDTEWNPDRSTYNGGATGTRALYDFLNESGYRVLRWRESPGTLIKKSAAVRPAVFVVVGETKEPFDEEERQALLDWVKTGGRLVLIDRRPNWNLLPPAGGLQVATEYQKFPTRDAHPDNPDEMTAGVSLARAVQPTLLTRRVATVMPSRFASHIKFVSRAKPTPHEQPTPDEGEPTLEELLRGTPKPEPEAPPPPVAGEAEPITAPVVHIADYQGPLVVDYSFGKGRIVLLSDPFIVANGGLKRADNLLLAINLVGRDKSALIAFDEFHQGHSAQQNQLLAYFAGTPFVPLLAQGGLLLGLFIWARGRRWARPLPLAQVDRRSKLEFVASMAELQQRAQAYDLALENIYTRTRRALARYAGVGHDAPNDALAQQIAARTQMDAHALAQLLDECAEHITGTPLKAARALELTAQLRELESRLGLRGK